MATDDDNDEIALLERSLARATTNSMIRAAREHGVEDIDSSSESDDAQRPPANQQAAAFSRSVLVADIDDDPTGVVVPPPARYRARPSKSRAGAGAAGPVGWIVLPPSRSQAKDTGIRPAVAMALAASRTRAQHTGGGGAQDKRAVLAKHARALLADAEEHAAAAAAARAEYMKTVAALAGPLD